MKKWKSVLALALSAAMSLSLLAGCGNGSGGKGGDSDSGSVYWLTFKPESDDALQTVAKMYTEETGVPVKVVTAASGTYNQTLNSEMDKSNAPTLFVIGNKAAVQQWKDYAMDLTDTPIAKELTAREYQLFDDEGRLVSISYCYECYGIIVNPDLLEKAGHKVEDITNFDSLKTVVEDIHNRADELGFDAFSSSDMDGSPPGVSWATWPTWSTTTSRRVKSGPSVPPPSPASIWTTSRTSMTCASTTA